MAKLGLSILIGFTAFRYWICLQAPVFPFEGYLHMCSRRLDTAFFDGPAGPATLVYLGNKFFTNELLALRWSAPLFSVLATIGCYFLGKKLYGVSTGLAAALCINILPAFQIASLQAESTLPTLTFWLLGMLFIWNAFKTENWRWWIAASLSLALGLQFSYWILLAPISCIFCILGKRFYRSPFSLAGWALLLLFCFLALIGPIEWNIRQSWLPFTGWTWQTLFSLKNGYTAALFQLLKQTSLPGAVLGGYALVLCLYYSRSKLKARFLAAFMIPAWIATLCSLAQGEVILLSLTPAFICLGGWWQKTTFPQLAWGTAITCGLTAFCSTIALIAWPSLSNQELQKAAITVEKIARTQNSLLDSSQGELFFIGENVSIVTEFKYIFQRTQSKETEIFLRESPNLSHQFRLWPSYCDFTGLNQSTDPFFTEQKGRNPYLGRSALYITPEKGILPQTISGAFQKVIPLEMLQIYRNGQQVCCLYIYLCRNYQTLPL